MRRSSGRGQETPYRHFRVRGPEVVAVSSHGPTEVGRQQRGQADRPTNNSARTLCAAPGMGAQRPASEDPGLGVRAAAEHLPRRGDGAREVKQLSTFQINFFSTFNFLKSSKSKFNCLHEMERKPEILPCLYRSSQFNVTKVPCQKTQIATRGCDGSKEIRGGSKRELHWYTPTSPLTSC